MRVTATKAKNRFGTRSAEAKREPVFAETAGQLDTVILSVEHHQALLARQANTSQTTCKKRFDSEFGKWIAAQNARVEALGIPGADLRPW